MITQRAKLRRLAFIRRPDPAAHEPRGNVFMHPFRGDFTSDPPPM